MAEYAISPTFANKHAEFQSGFADGWSKPHPYGGVPVNNNLPLREVEPESTLYLKEYHTGCVKSIDDISMERMDDVGI